VRVYGSHEPGQRRWRREPLASAVGLLGAVLEVCDMTAVLLLLIKVAVGVLILVIGMGATVADLTSVWRRPGLLLRSLLAMYVLVPLVAFLLVKTWPLAPGVKAALLVLAVSAGAPLLPRKLQRFESNAYVFSLVVISSLLAIVVVPAWIALLAWHFGVATELTAADVAQVMAKAFLLPLALGMLLRAVAPTLSERCADRAGALAGVVLTLAGLTLLVTHWQVFSEVRWQGMVALVVLLLLAVAIGHVLGGPHPDDRTALAIACATRHIGVAVIVATAFRGPRTMVLLAAYVVASAVVSLPYLQWRHRPARGDEPVAGGG
jgi:BASS family bile acid:Na+ symporter